MSRFIRNQRLPKSSGYETLTGPGALALAITQTQSAKISEGSDLEKMMIELSANPLPLSDPDVLNCLAAGCLPEAEKGYVISKNDIKKYLWPYLLSVLVEDWDTLSSSEQAALCQKHFVHDPDLAFVDTKNRTFTLVEMKSYCVFDTEKSQAIANKIRDMPIKYSLAYKSRARVVCFYAETQDDIVDGLKKKVPSRFVMTGAMFLKQIANKSMNELEGQSAESRSDNILYLLESALQNAQTACDPEDVRVLFAKYKHLA